jgi:hypothetical protein
MSLVEIKARTRRALHAQMGVPVTVFDLDEIAYPSAAQVAEGLTLAARFSTRARVISPDNDAMSIMENIEKLIFNSEELAALGLELEQAQRVMTPYGFDVRLDQQLDPDGPLNVYWTVTRA